MKKNGNNNKDAINLWGHDFNRTKLGLDEEQVVSFVTELISERDSLIKRQEHLSSLVQLAERTVAEADNIAKQVKDEALHQAKTESDQIVALAEEQAQQVIEEKRAEAVEIAKKDADAIKADADKEAKLLLKKTHKSIQSELKSTSKQLYSQLLSQFENLKQQVASAEEEFEQTLSQSTALSTPITMTDESDGNTTLDTDKDPEATNKITHDMLIEDGEQIETTDQLDTSDAELEVSESTEAEEATDSKKETVELEILPPVDISKVMGIMTYLDNLPEVENTELIPLTDKPLIEVFLHESIPLIDALETLAEVEHAEEVDGGETNAAVDAAYANDKRRKIQIILSGKSVLDESEDKQNKDAPKILSS
jgi:cell division septum initiation protein DivIVA